MNGTKKSWAYTELFRGRMEHELKKTGSTSTAKEDTLVDTLVICVCLWNYPKYNGAHSFTNKMLPTATWAVLLHQALASHELSNQVYHVLLLLSHENMTLAIAFVETAVTRQVADTTIKVLHTIFSTKSAAQICFFLSFLQILHPGKDCSKIVVSHSRIQLYVHYKVVNCTQF